MPNLDLEEFVDLLLGTGCREGEGLAIRPFDLTDLDGTTPTLHICGTLIEPRKGYVDRLHRQDTTKTRADRRLILPDAVATMLRERMRRLPPAAADAPVFASRTGNWISPSNMRTRLRGAVERAVEIGLPIDKELDGTSLHTLRRTTLSGTAKSTHSYLECCLTDTSLANSSSVTPAEGWLTPTA